MSRYHVRCLARGLYWTSLTTVVSFLGFLFRVLLSFLSGEPSPQLNSLVKDGSLILFSTTLASSIGIDLLLDHGPYSGRQERALKVVKTYMFISTIFSITCYPMLIAIEPSKVVYDSVLPITMGLVSSALAGAISVKAITLSNGVNND